MAYYRVEAKRNPMKPAEAPRYYAVQHCIGTLSEDDFVDRISRHCGYSRGTVKAVLTDLIDEVLDCVQLGYNVRMGEMGIFSIGVETLYPTETADKFTSSNIKYASLRLRLKKDFIEKVHERIKMQPLPFDIPENKPEAAGSQEDELAEGEDIIEA